MFVWRRVRSRAAHVCTRVLQVRVQTNLNNLYVTENIDAIRLIVQSNGIKLKWI